MPQARLPDINTAFITYRREVLMNLKTKGYASCFGSLFALNALLPEKYRVEISNPTFEETIRAKETLMATCKYCKENFEYKNLHAVQVLLTYETHYVSGQQYEKLWTCTKCHKDNQLGETELVQNVLKKPYFIHVVPEPPQRHEGLMARSTYHTKVTSWVWQFLDEIEERMAQFRDDNWTKSDTYEDDYEGELESEQP